MTWRILLRPSAEEDLPEAQGWYDSRVHGLGSEFREAVDGLFGRLAESPEIYPLVYRGFRRAKSSVHQISL